MKTLQGFTDVIFLRKPMSDTRVLTEADTECLCSAMGKSSRYSSYDLGHSLVADNTDA